MKIFILLFLTLQFISCSLDNNKKFEVNQIETEHSTNLLVNILAENINLIENINLETNEQLKASIFNHILFQIEIIKSIEESNRLGYSIDNQLLFRSEKSNAYCLINKFILSYSEKHPEVLTTQNRDTFYWITKKQEKILRSLDHQTLPASVKYDCRTYQFKL